MNTSGEAADQVVRMSLEVGEAALKISGEGAKQLAVLLYAVLQDQSNSRGKTKGRTRLESLVRTGKPLKVFSVKESNLKKFAKEAKRYGILYCAIRNPKENTDGMVDIMVKEEDAPRINRIIERFKLSAVEEKAKVETEVEAETETEVDKTEEKAEAEKEEAEKTEAEKTELEKNKEQGKENAEQNPSTAKTEKSHPSEPTSEKQEKDAEGTSKLYTGQTPERKSVREELKEIRAAKKQEADAKKQEVGLEDKKADTRKPSDKRRVQHKQPRQKKPRKKER